MHYPVWKNCFNLISCKINYKIRARFGEKTLDSRGGKDQSAFAIQKMVCWEQSPGRMQVFDDFHS